MHVTLENLKSERKFSDRNILKNCIKKYRKILVLVEPVFDHAVQASISSVLLIPS